MAPGAGRQVPGEERPQCLVGRKTNRSQPRFALSVSAGRRPPPRQSQAPETHQPPAHHAPAARTRPRTARRVLSTAISHLRSALGQPVGFPDGSATVPACPDFEIGVAAVSGGSPSERRPLTAESRNRMIPSHSPSFRPTADRRLPRAPLVARSRKFSTLRVAFGVAVVPGCGRHTRRHSGRPPSHG